MGALEGMTLLLHRRHESRPDEIAHVLLHAGRADDAAIVDGGAPGGAGHPLLQGGVRVEHALPELFRHLLDALGLQLVAVHCAVFHGSSYEAAASTAARR